MMNRQHWMTKGQWVGVNGQHWYGQIQDVAVTDAGGIMLLISSPKGIWRNHPAEWLQYLPEQIAPATAEDAIKGADAYIARIERMLDDAQQMKEKWEIQESQNLLKMALEAGTIDVGALP